METILNLTQRQKEKIKWKEGDYFYGKTVKDIFRIKKIFKICQPDGDFIACIADNKNKSSSERYLFNLNSKWSFVDDFVKFNEENMIKVNDYDEKIENIK